MIDKKIKKQIHKYSVISFDIFDTLLLRSCGNPEKVFEVVAERTGIHVASFIEGRLSAEKKARQKEAGKEITIDDIYDNLVQNFEVTNETLKKTEIFVEENIIYPNTEIVELFRYCCERKKVILTSDMYLDAGVIERMLKKAGITGYSKLYLSCEYGKKKSDGKLFELVLKEERISASQLFHIGDNLKSDYIVPHRLGIGTFLYIGKTKNCGKPYLVNAFIERKLKLERAADSENFYYRFGYRNLGPAIYGYVRWIHQQLVDRNISKVFFFAREGQFIQKAFDLIKEKDFDETYLFVSRRSLAVPALSSARTIKDFLALRPIYGRVKVKDQIEKVGLTVDCFVGKKWYDTCKERCFSELSNTEKQEMINDLFEASKPVAKEELELLLSYLKQEKVFGRFAVVDLGWNGSMQRALADIAEHNHLNFNMTGFFFAQRDEYYKNKDFIENYGYLFNYGDVSEEENLLLNSGTSLLELLFIADHGTTINYKRIGDIIEPVLADYEYKDIYAKIQSCQNAALDFIKDIQKERKLEASDDYKVYMTNMYAVFNDPDKEVIEQFGDLNYSDLNETDLYLARNISIYPLKKWLREFRDSGWKVAFLKRNLRTGNALKIYCFLRKKFN